MTGYNSLFFALASCTMEKRYLKSSGHVKSINRMMPFLPTIFYVIHQMAISLPHTRWIELTLCVAVLFLFYQHPLTSILLATSHYQGVPEAIAISICFSILVFVTSIFPSPSKEKFPITPLSAILGLYLALHPLAYLK